MRFRRRLYCNSSRKLVESLIRRDREEIRIQKSPRLAAGRPLPRPWRGLSGQAEATSAGETRRGENKPDEKQEIRRRLRYGEVVDAARARAWYVLRSER